MTSERVIGRLRAVAERASAVPLMAAQDVRAMGDRRRRRRLWGSAGLAFAIVAAAAVGIVATISPIAEVKVSSSGPPPKTAARGAKPSGPPVTSGASDIRSGVAPRATTSPGNLSRLPLGVTSRLLPSHYSFDQIAVSPSGSLLLSGTSSTAGGLRSHHCVFTTVNPRTLKLSAPSTIACGAPEMSGESVGIITHYHSGGRSGTLATMSTVRQESQPGGESNSIVDPTVMTYDVCSTCRPVTAYGGGKLWIYDNNTSHGAEVVEVSTVTGAVVATVPMPYLVGPLLAANDSGLYLGNSLEGVQGPVLYFIASGSKVVDPLVPNPLLTACWLTASQTSAWIGMGTAKGCLQQRVWRLNGGSGKPVYDTPITGYDITTVIGNEESGLWAIEWAANTTTSRAVPLLLRIDPATGTETINGRLPPIEVNNGSAGMLAGEGVILNGNLYLLEPPVDRSGYARLARIGL